MTAEDERLHSEVKKNTEFRIKYPRGELGQSSQDIEQFMLIEDLYKTVDRMQQHLDDMANNRVNIEFLKEQMEKAQLNIEKLKDANYVIYKMYHDKFIDKLYKFPIYLVFKNFLRCAYEAARADAEALRWLPRLL